jgi:hypothetical protein
VAKITSSTFFKLLKRCSLTKSKSPSHYASTLLVESFKMAVNR